MDVELKNGDLAVDRQGSPVPLAGAAALLQRAAIRLGVRRGSLPHDPAFGSTLHLLGAACNRGALEARALAAAREALAPMQEVGVRAVECAYDAGTGRLRVRLALEALGRGHRLEVRV